MVHLLINIEEALFQMPVKNALMTRQEQTMTQEEGIFGKGEPTAAIAVFTRRMARDERFHFFRTKSIEQLQRLRKFFPCVWFPRHGSFCEKGGSSRN